MDRVLPKTGSKRTMVIMKCSPVSLLLLALSTNLPAAWVKINDFESGADTLPYYAQTLATIGAELPGQIHGPLSDFMDESNTVLAMSPGFDGVEWNNLSIPLVLPPEARIPHGTTGTIYFRMAVYGYSLNVCLGPSFEEVRTEVDNMPWPRVWNEFATYMCLTNQTEPADQIMVHDGSGTPGNRKTPNSQVEIAKWYEIWAVVNNLEKTSQWYYRGPEQENPVLLQVPIFDGTTDTGTTRDFTHFRNNQRLEEPLKSFLIVTTNLRDKHQGDYLLLDDLHIDNGSTNLTSPLSTGLRCGIFQSEGWSVTDEVFGYSSATGGFYYLGYCPFVWDYGKSSWLYFFSPSDNHSFVFDFGSNTFSWAWNGFIIPL